MNLRGQRGQTTAEYVGLAFVLVAVVGVLLTGAGGIGARVVGGVQTAICQMAGACDGGRSGGQVHGAQGPQPGSAADGEVSDEVVAELAGLAADGSPAEVAALFDTLTLAQQTTLAVDYPQLAGGLDGALLAVRYDANRALINQAAAEMLGEADAWKADLDNEFHSATSAAVIEQKIAQLEGAADKLAQWASSDRQFLLFDPAGDGARRRGPRRPGGSRPRRLLRARCRQRHRHLRQRHARLRRARAGSGWRAVARCADGDDRLAGL